MRALLITVLSGALAVSAAADTWSVPTTRIVQSQDGNVAVRIVPNTNPGKDHVTAQATVTRWDAKTKSYSFVREVTLRNPQSPVTVVVTNDAHFLVTFDDWSAVGRTDNAVVIYDLLNGDVSNYRLEDFLPEEFRNKLERSISSVEWHQYDPFIQADQTIYVRIPGVEFDFVNTGYERHIVVDPARKRVWLTPERAPK
jgi:WD40 repeat protein